MKGRLPLKIVLKFFCLVLKLLSISFMRLFNLITNTIIFYLNLHFKVTIKIFTSRFIILKLYTVHLRKGSTYLNHI